MTISGICPVCKKHKELTHHHIFKSCVWKDYPETQSEILLVCRTCHDAIEIEITRRENNILRRYPDLYEGVVSDYISGALTPPSKHKRKKQSGCSRR
jgi:hypothetical protein